MNIWEWIMETTKYFIGTGLVTVAIVYIGKIAVGKIFDGLVEAYKKKLNFELEEFKNKQQTALEQFKAKQQKVLEEYKITYSRLHDKRAQVISDLYKKIVALETKINEFYLWCNLVYDDTNNEIKKDFFTNGEELLKESVEGLTEDMFEDFYKYVNENSIYFAEDLAESLKKLREKLNLMKNLRNTVEEYLKECSDNNYVSERFLNTEDPDYDYHLNERLKNVLYEIKKIKENIEKEFRKLLGVD